MAGARDLQADLPAGVPKPGDIFESKCRIERVLGAGGMGIVLLAHHLHLDQKVAVKLLLPEIARDQEIVARFVREGRAAVRIKSEHVARVLDVATRENGEPYMIMEYLEGRDLASVIEARGTQSITNVRSWVLQACKALAEAHAKGVVHRDLKPSNLFLARREDGTEHVKVLDFGISKLAQHEDDGVRITKTRAILGTPLYMSPEQLRASRDVDGRTDIWSLGIIMHELLCGQPPFRGNTIAEIGALVLVQDPPSVRAQRADVSPALEAIVRRCLAREPAHRFGSIEELARSLESSELASPDRGMVAASTIVDATPAIAAPTIAMIGVPSTRSRHTLFILLGLVMLALFGGALVALTIVRRAKTSEAVPTPSASVATSTAVPTPSASGETTPPAIVPADPPASASAVAAASVRHRPRAKPTSSAAPAKSQEPSSRPVTPSDRFNAP